MTQADATDIVDVILAAYPTVRQRMSDEQIADMARIYRAGLDDTDVVMVKRAVTRAVKSSKFLPTIAEIREHIVDVTVGTRRSGAEAWGDVMRAMSSKGAYRTPGKDFVFQDPLVVQALRQFNWTDLCRSENVEADRAHFIRAYDHAALAQRREAKATSMAALPERANRPLQLGEALSSSMPKGTP